MRFKTLAIHAGRTADPSGGVMPAIQLLTTFEREASGVPVSGHTYFRESNPNQAQLKAALAPLEGRRQPSSAFGGTEQEQNRRDAGTLAGAHIQCLQNLRANV
jgi:cystathionine beta-lyase/cystathionine gamma-synthase